MTKEPKVKNVPIQDVLDIPEEPELRGVKRGTFDDFCQQLAKERLVQPIAVRPHPDQDGKYQLIDGRHRAAAYRRNAKKGGRKTIRAEIHDVDDQEMRLMQVVANVQRTDYTPYEEAVDLQLMVDAGLKQTEIAKRIGKAQSHVSKRLQLLQLPAAIANQVGGDVDIKDVLWWKPISQDEDLAAAVEEHLPRILETERYELHGEYGREQILAQVIVRGDVGLFDACDRNNVGSLTGLQGWSDKVQAICNDGLYYRALRAAGAIEFEGRRSYYSKAPILLTRDREGTQALISKAIKRYKNKAEKAKAQRAKERAEYEKTPEGKEEAKYRKELDAQRDAAAAERQVQQKVRKQAEDRQMELVQGLTDRDVDDDQVLKALVVSAFTPPHHYYDGPIRSNAEQEVVRGILGEYAPKDIGQYGDAELACKLIAEDLDRAKRYIAAVLFLQERKPYSYNDNVVLVDSHVAPAATGKTEAQVLAEAKKAVQEAAA